MVAGLYCLGFDLLKVDWLDIALKLKSDVQCTVWTFNGFRYQMECAGKGRGTRCLGPPSRRCARCAAVKYCSASHQILHWSFHKEECERLGQQMKRVDVLNDFPFLFSQEATVQVCEKQESRCSFLDKRGIHRVGMWMHECPCGASVASFYCRRSANEGWHLPSSLCPCSDPSVLISEDLYSWKDYYEWRCIPLDSPVALLLHWPLTVYYATQVIGIKRLIPEGSNVLCIHYLGMLLPSALCSLLCYTCKILSFLPLLEKQCHFKIFRNNTNLILAIWCN